MRRPTLAKSKLHWLPHIDPAEICKVDKDDSPFTATKIICTIGPACRDIETLCGMLDNGMTCARLDLTWGSVDYHRGSLRNLEEAVRRTKRICAVLLDLRGRELMVVRDFHPDETGWWIHDAFSFNVAAGQEIILTGDPNVKTDGNTFVVNYEKFHEVVAKGDSIFLGRYLVSGADVSSCFVTVKDIVGNRVIVTTNNAASLDGLITLFHPERSADSIVNQQLDMPIMTVSDIEAIRELSKEFEIDFVSLSYTRDAQDVKDARAILKQLGLPGVKLISKLESRLSLFNFRQILEESDHVMLSRGNVGLDVAAEKMAILQKNIANMCNLAAKSFLITRVLDTMAVNPRPTRAEATDVANAVLDGVDAIMLGSETLRGKFPVDTVQILAGICRQAEKRFDANQHFEHLMTQQLEAEYALDDFMDGGSLHGEAQFFAHQTNLQRNQSNPGGRSVPSMPQIASTHKMPMPAEGSVMQLNKMGGMPSSGSAASFAAVLGPSGQMSKYESIASSAVRAAEKIQASLIMVFTSSGKTAQLVAKYRPAIPILTLVIPQLVSDGMRWSLMGRSLARQCCLTRGIVPMLATPSTGDQIIKEAITNAAKMGLAPPGSYMVCLQRSHTDIMLKVIDSADYGWGTRKVRNSDSTAIREDEEFSGPLSSVGQPKVASNKPQLYSTVSSLYGSNPKVSPSTS